MSDFNFLVLVADSCRWDTFLKASTPNIDEHFDVECAGAMATFTYPAHMAMFQGFFPTTATSRPVYNRFEKSVYRWFYSMRRPCLSELDGTGSIPLVLRGLDYRTVAVGGVGWFNKKTPMRLGFDVFRYEPKTTVAVPEFTGHLDKEPFYGLLNFGATHRPYRFPGIGNSLARVRSPRSGNTYKTTKVDSKLISKQAACLTHIDQNLASVFDFLSTLKMRTVVCFCADHGDCMGEDHCYGHGFSHPSVLTVPLAWTIFMPDGSHHPITNESLSACGF